MSLHCLHTLTRCKEGLSRCVAIDKDRVIADGAGKMWEIGQRMGKGFSRNKKVVLEVRVS